MQQKTIFGTFDEIESTPCCKDKEIDVALVLIREGLKTAQAFFYNKRWYTGTPDCVVSVFGGRMGAKSDKVRTEHGERGFAADITRESCISTIGYGFNFGGNIELICHGTKWTAQEIGLLNDGPVVEIRPEAVQVLWNRYNQK